MSKILLGVTGSVAAIKTPELYQCLLKLGHQVKIVATNSSLYFFDPIQIDGSAPHRNSEVVILDEDEWPGRTSGERYQRGDVVVHIELRRWADLFLVAPLDANTLGKFAAGLADNCLTCVWRAWDPAKPVVVAPAMNTQMWSHPMTFRQLRTLAYDFGASHIPGALLDHDLIAQLNSRCKNFRIVSPISKLLACGDIGIGAMAEIQEIERNVTLMLAP